MRAQAIWYTGQGSGVEIREGALGTGELLLQTVASGLSRGTERIVAAGLVPRSEWQRMALPNQEGDFALPIKYGYACVARVIEGPPDIRDRNVYTMHPHQTFFRADRNAVHVLPPDLPVRRATLAANMETALNAIWDAELPPGARVAVIGGGLVGCLVAYLARTIAKANVTLVDRIGARAKTASELRVSFTTRAETLSDCHTVFHTSASESGLSAAIHALAFEGQVIEMSWYGDRQISVPLGGAFHAQRLSIRCSQVGHVARSHRSTTSYADRIRTAIGLLDDTALDVLLTHEVAFENAERDIPSRIAPDADGIATAIMY